MLASLQYTALRSVIPSHQVGGTYVLPVLLGGLAERFEASRDIERADGGDAEYVLDRIDHIYTLDFAPVAGAELLALREFLDSTEAGESFRVIPYADELVLQLKRVDAGHTEAAFLRLGARAEDLFTSQITAINAPEEAEPVDIYNPINGPGLGDPTVRFIAGDAGSQKGLATVPLPNFYAAPAVFDPVGTLLNGTFKGGITRFGVIAGGGPPDFRIAVQVPFGAEPPNPQYAFFNTVEIVEHGVSYQPGDVYQFGRAAQDDSAFPPFGDPAYVTYRWIFPYVAALTPGLTYRLKVN